VTLAAPVVARVGVAGDSNMVLTASAAVQACAMHATHALALDYVATEFGSGLTDLDAIVSRFADLNVRCGGHDALVINWGEADLLHHDANWPAWFSGASGGIPYQERIAAVLASLPDDVAIYWLGLPYGLPAWAHPWEVSAINLALIAFEDPGAVSGAGFPHLLSSTAAQPDPRFRYVDTEALLVASGVSPRFDASLFHYSTAAAAALKRKRGGC